MASETTAASDIQQNMEAIKGRLTTILDDVDESSFTSISSTLEELDQLWENLNDLVDEVGDAMVSLEDLPVYKADSKDAEDEELGAQEECCLDDYEGCEGELDPE